MKDFYIYNITQAQFFLDNGLCPVRVGRGNRHGDYFLQFVRDEKAEKVFDAWKNRWKDG